MGDLYVRFLLFVGCVISALGALQLQFLFRHGITSDVHRVPKGPYVLWVCPLVFWLVLLPPQRPCSSSSTIRTQDLSGQGVHSPDRPTAQTRGIAHLGMFLFFSGQLLILQTDDYLERLWTVYEVATFLRLNLKGRLVILPVNP